MNVLHDGPVPEGLRLEELSNIRAKFIAEFDWASLEKCESLFQENGHCFPELSQILRSGTVEQL